MCKKVNAFLISIYFVSFSLIVCTIVFIFRGLNKFESTNDDMQYVVEEVDDNETLEKVIKENETSVPVVNDNLNSAVIRPYLSENVTIGKYFYNYEADSTEQEKALVYYENTYMQNSGVDYISSEKFDVVSILNGEVISVKEDEVLGSIVQIKHDNNMLSIYEQVEDVKVKEGDTIAQGLVIATSGKSKINTDYENVLHFEVYHNGEAIDPENFYSLNIEN